MPPKKGLGGFFDNFVSVETVSKESANNAKAAPTTVVAQSSPAVNPEVITSLLRSPAPTLASAPKAQKPAAPEHESRVPKLIEQLAAKIPADNALMKLALVEQQLDSAGIKDPAVRRTTALGILSTSQNVSDEEINRARAALSEVIGNYFDGLQQQVQTMNMSTLPQMRSQSEGLRKQVGDARTQIEALQAQIDTLTAEANRLDKEAADTAADLEDFKTEIETARAAALAQYCG